MTSFLATTFAVLAHQPDTICAVLATSRKLMNCSAVPVILSTDKTWDLLCLKQQENEPNLLELFSTFSDTMQFTEKLRIRNCLEKDFITGILENLIKNKRYFARTIRLLDLPAADVLIEACSSFSSSTAVTTTPTKRQLLSNLRSLSIEGSFTVRNEQLKTICSLCPFLEKLIISGQELLFDEGVEFLSSLKHLKTLDLHYCISITDSSLEHLATLSSLRSLDLGWCVQITDTGLEHLAALLCLQSLNLSRCGMITDVGLQHLAKMSSLQSLNLECCNYISKVGIEHLTNLSSLQTVHLGYCLITDSCLEHLAKLPSLQVLNLICCFNITDSGLQHLAKISSLQSLNLRCNGKITDSGLQHLSTLSSLRSLDLYCCIGITDSGRQWAKNLRNKLPSTHIERRRT